MIDVCAGEIAVDLAENAAGVIRAACPYCSEPLVLRVVEKAPEVPADPLMPPAAALRLQMSGLTPLQRYVFDVLYAAYPALVKTKVFFRPPIVLSPAGLRMLRSRMSAQLRQYGWSTHSSYGTLHLIREK